MELRVSSAKYLSKALHEAEVGPTPADWVILRMDEITDLDRPISYGIVQTGPRTQNGVPCLRVVDIQDGKVQLDDLVTTTEEISNAYRRTKLREGDLVAPLRGKVGECAQISKFLAGANLTRGVALIAVLPKYSAAYCRQFFSSSRSRARLNGAMNGSALQELSIAALRSFKLSLPPTLDEQDAIANTLTDADTLIDSLEQLLVKKRQVKQGAMQELLTGKRRLPGFSLPWQSYRLDEIADPVTQFNRDAAQIPVLTCSKHLGFVDSLVFFKNQVFSNDTSTYKVVLRGQLAYPANHVEEGSIGYQDLYEAALVSPIYVVFQPRTGINGKFLHRLLKLPQFLPVFGKFTSSSVDRRGSLRWPAFSTIEVALPAKEEQLAVIQVIEALETEVAVLESRLTKARALKQAMAQALLTGRIRLVEPTV